MHKDVIFWRLNIPYIKVRNHLPWGIGASGEGNALSGSMPVGTFFGGTYGPVLRLKIA